MAHAQISAQLTLKKFDSRPGNAYIEGSCEVQLERGTPVRIARAGIFAQDAIDFGDGTTAANDVAGEWYFVRVWDVNDPAAVPEPNTLVLFSLMASLVLFFRRVK